MERAVNLFGVQLVIVRVHLSVSSQLRGLTARVQRQPVES